METVAEKTAEKTEKALANDVLKTIYIRRSIRKYKDTAVPREIIEQLLDAGRMAPSAINKQPWKFYILTDKEKIYRLSKEIVKAAAKGVLKSGIKEILKTAADYINFPHGLDFIKEHDPIFHDAPVVIFVTSTNDNEWTPLDIGMCSQNIMLAAKSLGLDSCPVGIAKFVEQTRHFRTMGIPTSETVHLAIIAGYGDETPEPHKRTKNNAVYL